MALSEARQEAISAYLLMMLSRDLFGPYGTFQEACQQFNVDVNLLLALHETRYLNGRDNHVPKAGNMHLAWEHKEDPAAMYPGFAIRDLHGILVCEDGRLHLKGVLGRWFHPLLSSGATTVACDENSVCLIVVPKASGITTRIIHTYCTTVLGYRKHSYRAASKIHVLQCTHQSGTRYPGAAQRGTGWSFAGSHQVTRLQCFSKGSTRKDGCGRLTQFDHTPPGIFSRAQG